MIRDGHDASHPRASADGLAVLALAAIKLRARAFHFATLTAMLAQPVWRGFLVVVGS